MFNYFESDKCDWIPQKEELILFKNPQPVILYLHGVGERGNGGEELSKVLFGLDSLKKRNEEPFNEFIIAAPQCLPDYYWHSPHVMHALEELVNKIVEHEKIDENRIYLTGFSMGGIGVMELAMKHPNRFAVIAPVCGKCENINNINKIIDAKTPIWVIYAENDEKAQLTIGSKEIISRFENVEYPHKKTILNHRLKPPEDALTCPVNHIEARKVAFSNPELYKWFLSNQLNKISAQI